MKSQIMNYLIIKSVMVTVLIDYCFYRSIWGIIPAGIIGIIFYREEKREVCRRENEKFRQQFKELLYLAAAGQKAGYSVENAFMGSYEDLKNLYGEKSEVCLLLKKMSVGLENHIPMAELWKKAGKEYEVVEITEFAKVFEIAKESGGNMTEILENTAEVIGNKAETKQEIDTLLSARRLEQRIMNAMPIVLMLYVELTSPGYFSKMYHSGAGIGIMTAALAIYLLAYFWGKRISDITQ